MKWAIERMRVCLDCFGTVPPLKDLICAMCSDQYSTLDRNSKYCKKCTPDHTVGGRNYTRSLVRIRDKYTCQNCGFVRTEKEVLSHNCKIKGLKGRIKNLDVHHINGLCGKNSRGVDSVNDMDILITLCHKCHYNRHDRSKKLCSTAKN